jgi:hypothetical protein
MSKRNRLRKETLRTFETETAPSVGLQLGDHQFRAFDGVDCAFGARLKDYPPYDTIPEKFRLGHSQANKVVSTLFFRGGKLEDFGLRLKVGVDPSAFYGAFKAMLCSFEPKHEHKEAACAWLVSEFTEATE